MAKNPTLEAILSKFTSVLDLTEAQLLADKKSRFVPVGDRLAVRKTDLLKWRKRIQDLEALVFRLEEEIADLRRPESGNEREIRRLRRLVVDQNKTIAELQSEIERITK